MMKIILLFLAYFWLVTSYSQTRIGVRAMALAYQSKLTELRDSERSSLRFGATMPVEWKVNEWVSWQGELSLSQRSIKISEGIRPGNPIRNRESVNMDIIVCPKGYFRMQKLAYFIESGLSVGLALTDKSKYGNIIDKYPFVPADDKNRFVFLSEEEVRHTLGKPAVELGFALKTGLEYNFEKIALCVGYAFFKGLSAASETERDIPKHHKGHGFFIGMFKQINNEPQNSK